MHGESMGPWVLGELVYPCSWLQVFSGLIWPTWVLDASFFLYQASYCLIDSFLGNSELIGDLTQCVDCVIPAEGSAMQVLRQLWK